MVMSFCIRSMASWFTTWAFTFSIYLSSISLPITWNFPDLKASSSRWSLLWKDPRWPGPPLQHALIMGRGELGAILPVYLIAVVFRRIVAGSDIDA